MVGEDEDVLSYKSFIGLGFKVDGIGVREIRDVACVEMVFGNACDFGGF